MISGIAIPGFIELKDMLLADRLYLVSIRVQGEFYGSRLAVDQYINRVVVGRIPLLLGISAGAVILVSRKIVGGGLAYISPEGYFFFLLTGKASQ